MSILTSKRFQKYFVPGIVFQSCVIAGGYGTGRELVEYFMGYGPKGGLLEVLEVVAGRCVSYLCWCGPLSVRYPSCLHKFSKNMIIRAL